MTHLLSHLFVDLMNMVGLVDLVDFVYLVDLVWLVFIVYLVLNLPPLALPCSPYFQNSLPIVDHYPVIPQVRTAKQTI